MVVEKQRFLYGRGDGCSTNFCTAGSGIAGTCCGFIPPTLVLRRDCVPGNFLSCSRVLDAIMTRQVESTSRLFRFRKRILPNGIGDMSCFRGQKPGMFQGVRGQIPAPKRAGRPPPTNSYNPE